jgi:hypothetical protein
VPSDKNPHSWELYIEAQRKYTKEGRHPKNAWRTFRSSINDLPRAAKLHGALSREPKIKLGSLVAPSGRRTQSEGETLELLLTTHLGVAAKVVTYRRVEWTVVYYAPYKSPGMGGIFPNLLQQ